MASCNCTVHFRAPKERVFEAISDFRNADQRISAITKLEVLTDGPIGKGTRFKETRVVMKREATEEMEILEFNPPNGYAVGCTSCGAEFRSTFELQASPQGGCDLHLTISARPISFIAKLMSPLSGMMMGACKKAVLRDMEEIRAHIEGPTGAISPA